MCQNVLVCSPECIQRRLRLLVRQRMLSSWLVFSMFFDVKRATHNTSCFKYSTCTHHNIVEEENTTDSKSPPNRARCTSREAGHPTPQSIHARFAIASKSRPTRFTHTHLMLVPRCPLLLQSLLLLLVLVLRGLVADASMPSVFGEGGGDLSYLQVPPFCHAGSETAPRESGCTLGREE